MEKAHIETVIKALVEKIDYLEYTKALLEEENQKLRDSQKIEVNIHAKPEIL